MKRGRFITVQVLVKFKVRPKNFKTEHGACRNSNKEQGKIEERNEFSVPRQTE